MVNTVFSHGLSLPLRRTFTPLVSLFLLFSAAILSAEDTVHPAKTTGHNLKECHSKLATQGAGWCEISVSKQHPSISSVWPKNLDKKTTMNTGPASVLIAWNSAAFDKNNRIFYFFGGGHADYGGNEVYRFELDSGSWLRLTEPSPLNHLFAQADYKKREGKPWRRLCWTTDTRRLPASTHTYDGLIFSHATKTIFLYNMRAANGSCFEDTTDSFKNSSAVIGSRTATKGWYEFNPSIDRKINELPPLSWRKVFDAQQLSQAHIHQGYPASAELDNGKIIFGSKHRTAIYNPTNSDPDTLSTFSHQADWGDGTKEYDNQRAIVWSLHQQKLLAFDAKNGHLSKRLDAKLNHGKSIAISNAGDIVSWNGKSKIFSLNPDQPPAEWQVLDWGIQGPTVGDSRVYGKWVYLPEFDVFIGLSSHKTGVWVYKHLR